MLIIIHYLHIPRIKSYQSYYHITSWCTHSNSYLDYQQHPMHYHCRPVSHVSVVFLMYIRYAFIKSALFVHLSYTIFVFSTVSDAVLKIFKSAPQYSCQSNMTLFRTLYHIPLDIYVTFSLPINNLSLYLHDVHP